MDQGQWNQGHHEAGGVTSTDRSADSDGPFLVLLLFVL